MVAVTQRRIQSINTVIKNVLDVGRLSSGDAAALAGKLGFAITATFGKIGRAKIRPIILRAYSRITHLSANLECRLRWWLRYLRQYRPRPVPMSLGDLPTIIS